MERIHPDSQDAARREPISLIGIVRLLARQAAREWAEQQSGGDCPRAPLPLPEKQS
jgi:hypothetical protein